MQNSVYGYLSKYRSELMGIAILVVVWFHTGISFDFIGNTVVSRCLNFAKEIGYGGVDIFFLVSGFGVWHSLQKNSLPVFFKNRLVRILSVWWPYLIIRVVLDILVYHIPVRITEILGFAFLTGYWQGMQNQGNWYVYAIFLFYLFSPFLYSVMSRKKQKTALSFWMVLLAVVLSFSFFNHDFLIVFSRLPVFIIGMYLAADPDRFVMNRLRWLAGIGISIIMILSIYVMYKTIPDVMWDYGLYWYPFIFIAPAVSILICKVFNLIDRNSIHVGRVFRHIGEASLEILLVSDFIYSHSGNFYHMFGSANLTGIILLLFSVLAGILFHFLIRIIKEKVFHKKS